MRIAQIATSATPVRRDGADSIESIVWLLGRELTRLGHEVTTFACAGSEVFGQLIEVLPGPYAKNGSPADWELCEWLTISRALTESARFDVMHSHNYLWGIPIAEMCQCPMVHTLHVTPYDDDAFLRRRFPEACVTGISDFQWSAFADLRPWANVWHGIDPGQFALNAAPQDYLLYLGRFTPGKGVAHAIDVAQSLKQRLVVAGPANEYFDREIRPRADGESIQYVGPVYGEQRSLLLGGARALLYPVQAPEPFGLVMVEAMACGTPVAAVAIGAVPEIIEEDVTGCTSADVSGLPDAVLRAAKLDRAAVRARALARFSAAAMARGYEWVYETVIAESLQAAHATGRRGGE